MFKNFENTYFFDKMKNEDHSINRFINPLSKRVAMELPEVNNGEDNNRRGSHD